MGDYKFDLGKALASERINWEYHAREQKDRADKLEAAFLRLWVLLDSLRPELCVDCYQILHDYEHPEEELSDE